MHIATETVCIQNTKTLYSFCRPPTIYFAIASIEVSLSEYWKWWKEEKERIQNWKKKKQEQLWNRLDLKENKFEMKRIDGCSQIIYNYSLQCSHSKRVWQVLSYSLWFRFLCIVFASVIQEINTSIVFHWDVSLPLPLSLSVSQFDRHIFVFAFIIIASAGEIVIIWVWILF